MFNLEQINQQIDNIKNISLTLNDTPIYNGIYDMLSTMFIFFFTAFAVSLCVGVVTYFLYSSDLIGEFMYFTAVCCSIVASLASIFTYINIHGSTFKHKNDQFELLHEGKYKFDTKVDIINKSYRDMFGEKYVSLPEIRDRLKIEFLHADEFKKLSGTEQEEIINAIDELKPDLILMMSSRKFLIGQ